MGKKEKKSSKPKFELKFTRQALDQLKEPETKFEELSNKLEKLGIKLEEWWTKFEGLGIKFKKSWIKFKEKLKSSSSQESKIQDHNLDNDNIYVVDYVNGNYEIYHPYEQIIYNEVVPESTINWSEDSYADTSCDSFESSETGHENEFSLDVNEGASCSKIGNVEKKVPPLVPPMPTRQSIKAYRKNRNGNYNSNNNDYLSMNGNNYEKMSHNSLQSQNSFTFPTSSINSSDHYYDTVYDSNALSPASPRLISQGSASSQVGNSAEVSSIPLNPTFWSMSSKQSINNSHKNENEFSLDVNEGASCSKIGNVEKKVPPLVPPMPTRQSIKAYRKNRNGNYNSNNNDYLSMNGNNYEKMSHNSLQSQNSFTFPTSSINSSDHYYDTVYDSNALSPASPRLISQGSASSQVGNSAEVSSIPLNPTFWSMSSKQSINNSHKNENEFSLDINEGASCSKIGNAEKKVPPATLPKPKKWNSESASNINNLQVNNLDLRQIRQSLPKTNCR